MIYNHKHNMHRSFLSNKDEKIKLSINVITLAASATSVAALG